MRIVLDTNVFIAAALRAGLAEDIIRMAATTNLVTLITSEEILSELANKLIFKFGWNKDKIHFFVNNIREIANVVDAKRRVSFITRDPEDNKILECALAGKADLIISSDQDLIALKKFEGIAIIHPKTLTWTFPQYLKKQRATRRDVLKLS